MAEMKAKDYSYKGNLENHVYLQDIDEEIGKDTSTILYSIKTEDSFSLGRFDVGTYLHGRCHLFALIAHEMTGLPINILCLPDYHCTPREGDLSKGILISHVYLDIGKGHIWDTEGTNTLQAIVKKYEDIEENVYDQEDVSFDILKNSKENVERIKAMMIKGYIAKFAVGERESIELYIKDVLALEGNKVHNENSPIYKKIDEITMKKLSNNNSQFRI